MATATASSLVETGKAALDLARRQTMRMIEDIPAGRLTHQPVPGANHVLWVMGHLARTDDFFATALGSREAITGEKCKELYGMGSTPVDDPDTYPSFDELKEAMHKTRQSLITWIESLSEEQLLEPLPEDFRPFAPNNAAVPGAIAWHEGLHAGQLSAVRRSLELPRTLG